MGIERELQAEQDFLDQAYARLDAMRADANSMLEGVLDLGKGGTFQSRTERDVIVRTSLARLEQLDIGDQALAFGRIDRLVDGAGGEHGTSSRNDADSNGAAGQSGAASNGAASQNGAASNGAAGQSGAAGYDTAGDPPTEVFHIGRLAIHGSDHEPLVVDWRAPVAEPFYRATGRDPLGLTLRRHLAIDGRQVVGVEDERFGPLPPGDDGSPLGRMAVAGDDDDDGDGDGGELILGDVPIGGPAALLAALGRARSGRMTDIVGTIQREQDEIIRSPLPGVLLVQGGPGTGKTAVALHRAAYLLYTHRFPLERQGVLVVGPNPLFLRYIEQVLPSLGETGVTLSTVAGLVPEIKVTGTEPAAVAKLKGDPRMAKVIARAVRTRQRPLRDDVAIPYGALLLRLGAEETREIVDMARRRPGSHNARRKLVTQAVVGVLAERARNAQQTLGADLGDGVLPFPGYEDPSELGDDGLDLEDFSRKVRRVPELADALDRMWPRLSPHELLHDLFGARPLITAAAGRSLTPEEQALLHRPRSSSLDQVTWTSADAALVDEARHLLGPRNGGAEEAIRHYGHIVVDEVQDLSPMQLRMLTRRSLSGSMTVVGDIAQATAPWAPKRWEDITRYLPNRRPARMVELTVSYRTPAEVLEVAARVLAAAAPELQAPRPVRRTGVPPRLIAVPGGAVAGDRFVGPGDGFVGPGLDGSGQRTTDEELAALVADVAGEELAAVGPGRVAILAPEELLPVLAAALESAGLPAVDPRQRRKGGLSEPLVLLAADAANGLEFDGVVVVEPGLIAGETARGLRTLYVDLTRPTQRLAVVSAAPPPAMLAAGDPDDRSRVAVAD